MNKNELYPIFLKVNQLHILIIGGGKVGEEKLHFLLKSSPNAQVHLVAPNISDSIKTWIKAYDIHWIKDHYAIDYLDGKHLVIAATNSETTNVQIYKDCKKRRLLVNVADNPRYCDFYLGGIVTKGNVKIAISTNGKSPTTAKRLRQFFEDVIPNEINTMVENLNHYRHQIQGDFSKKVESLNLLTETLIK